MKPTQQKMPQLLCQMTMSLDGKHVWGMTAAERAAAVGALASLLLEAAGVPAKEARVPAKEARDDRG